MPAPSLFTLKALAELDHGKVAEQVETALKAAGQDCVERPGEKRVRKVTLQIEMVPFADERGFLERVKTTFQVKQSLPTRTTNFYDCDARKTGQLVFNDLYPNDSKED